MAMDSKENFDNWLESVVEVFDNLLPHQKEVTLMRLISESNPELKYVLVHHVCDVLQQDILTSLPNELKAKIFSYIDGKSMLTACTVSKKWNGIISSMEDVWHVKCMEDEFQKMEGISWKEKYVEGLRFIERIRSGEAFSIKTLRIDMFAGEGISRMFISNGYLFASAGRHVGIWHVGPHVDELLVYFITDTRIMSMCDYETKCLICGHVGGRISMWAWESDGTVEKTAHFIAHFGAVTCVAVSKDMGLIATGGGNCVKLWCLKNKRLLFTHAKYSSMIKGVLLKPTFNPDAVNKGNYVLLVRSRNLIQLFQWSLKTSNLCSSCNHGILEEMLDDTTSLEAGEHSNYNFPEQYYINQGKLFYIIFPMHKEIIVYDLNSKCKLGKIYMADKFPFILAVGGKFALVMQEAVSFNYGFSLLNITTKSEVVRWFLPVTGFEHYKFLRVAVPNTSWLDDVSNCVHQLMLAYTATTEQINVVFWNVHNTPG